MTLPSCLQADRESPPEERGRLIGRPRLHITVSRESTQMRSRKQVIKMLGETGSSGSSRGAWHRGRGLILSSTRETI